MSDCGFEHDAGAYVLGALAGEERTAFERHLASCPACARSVRELAGLPGLLARVPVEVVEDDEEEQQQPVPDTLLPGAVRRYRRTRTRRRWLVGGLVAAAATVALAGGLAVGTQLGDDEAAPSAAATTAPAVAMEPVGEVPIKATVAMTSVGWGTRLDFTCEYDEDAQEGGPAYRDESQPSYAMYVRTASGSEEQVASWRALPHKVLRIAAATAAERDDITEVEVRASDGRTVLRLPA